MSAPAEDPVVEVDLGIVAGGVQHRRQEFQRCEGTVELPPAVGGDDDSAVVDDQACVGGVLDAFDDQWPMPQAAQPRKIADRDRLVEHQADHVRVRAGQAAEAAYAVAEAAGHYERALDLTPSERQVAVAVASGATNRETADRLFLGVNTVEATLSRVYRKLGIRSRAELATVLEQRPADAASQRARPPN